MEKNKILFLDFDGHFKNTQPDLDTIVLCSGFEGNQIFDVRKFKNNLDADVDEFSSQWEELIQKIPQSYRDSLKANQAPFFRNCISPISRWMEAIDQMMDQHTITRIVFSSYTNNDKIFAYEAEGEINKPFLYQGNAYFPYYLKLYIAQKFQQEVTIRKQQGKFAIRTKHRLRNFILFHFIVLKQFLFKITTFKRNYGIDPKSRSILISSRAVVQTEFIHNYQNVDPDAVLIVNEQSFSLLRHLKYLKKNARQFIYAEGFIKFGDFFAIQKRYFQNLFGLRKLKKTGFDYHGIRFSSPAFLPDLLTKDLDYIFYSTSVKNAIAKYKLSHDGSRVISFEMFTAYPYFLKQITHKTVFQIQTTLIEPIRNTDFIGGDHFYFTNPVTYRDFVAKNELLTYKMGCIPYLKYVGCKKKQLNDHIRAIVYFTQPIDLEEENEIIHALEEYCLKKSIKFTIKPHPRQLTKFNLISEKTVVSGPAEDVENLILDSDVVITRSSSIGLDAWIYGVPPMFMKLNKPLQAHNIFYAPNDYKGTIFLLNQLEEILDDYEGLKQQFLNHPLAVDIRNSVNKPVQKLFKL